MATSTLPPLSLPDNAVWFGETPPSPNKPTETNEKNQTVTGTSSGIGLSLITAILSSHPSHRIVALSRNPKSIPLPPTSNAENTLLQPVDLTSESSISAAFDAALARFGRIDVVVNNAGYGLLGELESVPVQSGRDLFEINFWAAVRITKHALRVMRAVNPLSGPIGGVIAQVSSAGGYITTPGQSFYHASKWALEGFSESIAKELDPEWNIRFVIFEPGSVKTRWSGENQAKGIVQHEAYRRPEGKGLATELIRDMKGAFEQKIGADAGKVAEVMVGVVVDREGTWGGRELLRLPVGADSWTLIQNDVKETGKQLDKWRAVSESTSPGGVKDTLKTIGLLKE
jgi:NAD(P)-dependent dehydrogenase (short-subunit alcohol dehydrogenase family)